MIVFILVFFLFNLSCAQFVANSDHCHGPSSMQYDDCTVTCGTNVNDFSSIALSEVYSRIFSWSSPQYNYAMTIPICGLEPNFPSMGSYSPTPSWSTSDIWQFTRGSSSEAYYLGTYISSGWHSGTYSGQIALSASFISGQLCPNSINRQTTLYLVCNRLYSSMNPSITLTETTTCNYAIVIEYSDLCADSTVPTPTMAPTSNEAEISRAAEVEVIVAVVMIMMVFVGCYVSCRKFCFKSEGKYSNIIHPVDATYGNGRVGDSVEISSNNVELVQPRMTSNDTRERERRCNQLYDQMQISAEQGYSSSSNVVPTATAVSFSSTNTAVAAIPVATVVVVNGVRV